MARMKGSASQEVTLGQHFQPWIQWGDPTEPVSQYQQLYDSYNEFNDKELKRIQKSSLFKNLNIMQQAMAKTMTTFVPSSKSKASPEKHPVAHSKTLKRPSKLNFTSRKTDSATNSPKRGDQPSSLPKIVVKESSAQTAIKSNISIRPKLARGGATSNPA